MPIVTDNGFAPDRDTEHLTLEHLAQSEATGRSVQIGNTTDPELLIPHFPRLARIVIPFATFSDGRGFSLARQLRERGFEGRLRATGHIISDQYAMARDCGFDEIEIEDSLAARQPAAIWATAQNGPASYRRKLAATTKSAAP